MLLIQGTTHQPVRLPITPRTFLDLPEDVIHQILLHLGVESTRDCTLVCRNLSEITQKDRLWQRLYFRDFYYQPKQNKSQSFLQAYQGEFNLKKGRFTWKTLAKLPYFGYGRTAQFCLSNAKLCIEQHNRGIIVQDLATKEQFGLAPVQLGHSHSRMAIHKNHLFSCRGNGTADVYDLETKKHLKTFGESSYPSGVVFILCDNKFILGQGNKDVLVWDIDTQDFLSPIKLPSGLTPLCMAASEQKLFLGTCKGGPISVLDIETGSLLNTLPINEPTLTNCLIVSENKLIAGNRNGWITIWDKDTAEHLYTLTDGVGFEVTSLFAANGKLFSAHGDHTVKVWKMGTGECLSTLKIHGSNQLYAMDNKIFSGSFSDGKIKVCDFSESHNAILANAAELFREGDHEVRIAMEQFKALPASVRNQVYDELYQLLKPFDNDYWGCAEHAFLGECRLSSTRQQKAQAIENYLSKHKPS